MKYALPIAVILLVAVVAIVAPPKSAADLARDAAIGVALWVGGLGIDAIGKQMLKTRRR